MILLTNCRNFDVFLCTRYTYTSSQVSCMFYAWAFLRLNIWLHSFWSICLSVCLCVSFCLCATKPDLTLTYSALLWGDASLCDTDVFWHVFTFSGSVNTRTHCTSRIVNRASRFHKSAGLDDMDHGAGRNSPVLNASGSPTSTGGMFCSHLYFILHSERKFLKYLTYEVDNLSTIVLNI